MRLVRTLALACALLAPLPALAQSAPVYRSASPITPGTPVQPGDGVALACSAAGNLRMKMQDDSLLDFVVSQGTAVVDGLAVRDVSAAGTTATCTVTVLRRG